MAPQAETQFYIESKISTNMKNVPEASLSLGVVAVRQWNTQLGIKRFWVQVLPGNGLFHLLFLFLCLTLPSLLEEGNTSDFFIKDANLQLGAKKGLFPKGLPKRTFSQI